MTLDNQQFSQIETAILFHLTLLMLPQIKKL